MCMRIIEGRKWKYWSTLSPCRRSFVLRHWLTHQDSKLTAAFSWEHYQAWHMPEEKINPTPSPMILAFSAFMWYSTHSRHVVLVQVRQAVFGEVTHWMPLLASLNICPCSERWLSTFLFPKLPRCTPKKFKICNSTWMTFELWSLGLHGLRKPVAT